MELLKKYKTLLGRYGVNTILRQSMFLAQMDHESGLKPISENLNYSESGLLKIFSKYFTPTEAKKFARNPEKIANRVYADRMGNGNECSGDGWKYRGRGFIQLTGKNNYKALSNDTNIDYLNNPDWLLREADAMIAALWYWDTNNLNKWADLGDIDTVSDIINIGRSTEKYGDANGFKDRKSKYNKYLKLLTS